MRRSTMRLIAAVALALVLGFSDRANAQYVVGTYGTPSAGLGYYSPTPGVMYSPFRQAPAFPTYTTGFGNYSGYGNHQFGGYPQTYSNGYTVTRFYSPYTVTPHYGTGGFNNTHGMRRW